MLKRFVVGKNERGIVLRKGDFVALLGPGVHWRADAARELELHTLALAQARFAHPLESYLLAAEPAIVEANFHRIELTDSEVALRSENGLLVEVIPPGARRLYWRAPAVQQFERIDVSTQLKLPAELRTRILLAMQRGLSADSARSVMMVTVPAGHVGVMTVDGAIERLLPPGPNAFWRHGRTVQVEVIDTRATVLEVSGQEILTRDKVALRVNLTAHWRYLDVQRAFEALSKPVEHLYRELQLALRAVVGTRTLDELLERKDAIDEVVSASIVDALAAVGIELSRVGVKDVVLPGDMKALLARVVEAEKIAQANVIRRREETAATRSLLNTAKVMEDNPVAMRMKELETLERVAERIGSISVVGGLESVLTGLVRLVPPARADAG